MPPYTPVTMKRRIRFDERSDSDISSDDELRDVRDEGMAIELFDYQLDAIERMKNAAFFAEASAAARA